jgi:O-antigen/teichoic acid export membrane protein
VSETVVETRAAKAALAAALSMGLAIALQLISVPICLRFWGEETYGLWLALLALATLVRTFDFGFTAYVGNEINLQYHRDTDELRRTLSSAIWGAILIAGLELLAGVGIVLSGALAELAGIPEPVARQGRAGLVFLVLLLGFVSTAPFLGVVHKLLIPAGMLHQGTWWFMGLQIAQSASVVAAASLGLDLTGAAVLFAISQGVIQGGSALYVAHKLPRFLPWWRNPSWKIGMRDLLRSTAVVGATLLTQTGTNGVVMLVSGGLGAAAVPGFTTVRTLSTLWATITNVLTSPLLPDVVRYHAQGEGRKLAAALEAHWLISNAMVNLSILAVLPFLDPLYRAWTGGRVVLDRTLLASLLVAVVVGTPGALVVAFLTSINALRAMSTLFAVRGLVPLAAGAALLPWLGVVGVGVGIALGELLGPVVVGGLYLRSVLRRYGNDAPLRWQPAAAGTAIASGFLLLQAWRGFHLDLLYAAALLGVTGTVIWGWRAVPEEVRGRVLGLLRRRAA